MFTGIAICFLMVFTCCYFFAIVICRLCGCGQHAGRRGRHAAWPRAELAGSQRFGPHPPQYGDPYANPLSSDGHGGHSRALAAANTEPVLIVTLPDDTVRIGMPCGDTGSKGADDADSAPLQKVAPHVAPADSPDWIARPVLPGLAGGVEQPASLPVGSAQRAPPPPATGGEVELPPMSAHSGGADAAGAEPAGTEPRGSGAGSIDRTEQQECRSGGGTDAGQG